MISRNTGRTAFGALACLVLALAAGACDSSGGTCHLIAFSNHLGMHFITPDRREAVYTVNIRGGALDVSCRIQLSEEAFEEGPERFEAGNAVSDGGARFVHCESREGSSSGFESVSWRIRRKDDGFDVELGVSMPMGTAPARVRIEMLRDETVLVDRRIRPDYTVTEPNGPGCGFQKAADIQLSLDD